MRLYLNHVFIYFAVWASRDTVFAQKLSFPEDFKFGVATAAYQIEGSWNEGGKGENIWDFLTHNYPQLIEDGKSGDIACDSYHKWREDIQMVKSLGVQFYRFSLSWSRILPSGFTNRINPEGVAYYNNIINELLKNGIEPMVTLYHWDLPQPLMDLGGWPNPLLAQYFEDYAKVAFELFGDRVKTWITINEPPEICKHGYEDIHAPHVNSSGLGSYLCGHTVLLAHARAYRLYEREFKSSQNGSVGLSINCNWNEPKSTSSEDQEASERTMQMECGWWMNPILSKTGDYPLIMKQRVANVSKAEGFPRTRLPSFTEEEIRMMQGSFDFCGLNHYTTYTVKAMDYPASDPVSFTKDAGVEFAQDPNWENSLAPWIKVVPWGFRKLLKWIKDQYGNPPVVITENGFADDGRLQDSGRISYYAKFLKALLQAIHEDGCNVQAYTAWSAMDNMEWRYGYTPSNSIMQCNPGVVRACFRLKFGLFHVDFNSPNRTRTPKKSAEFYKYVVKTKGIDGWDERI